MAAAMVPRMVGSSVAVDASSCAPPDGLAEQIRTTSSFFTTADSVHVYSSLGDIKNKYAVKKSGQYNSDGRTIILYDDKQKGIAFETASAGSQNICTGIIIHPKDKSVNDIYIMLHPDMKRFDK